MKGLVLAAIFAASGAVCAAAPELEANTDEATAGYFQLRWSADEAVEVQESQSQDFREPRTLYSGSDRARVLSGKPDGDWYYRARPASGGDWSKVVKVTVRHHPLNRAIGYFLLGAVVFLATVVLIAAGARRRA